MFKYLVYKDVYDSRKVEPQREYSLSSIEFEDKKITAVAIRDPTGFYHFSASNNEERNSTWLKVIIENKKTKDILHSEDHRVDGDVDFSNVDLDENYKWVNKRVDKALELLLENKLRKKYQESKLKVEKEQREYNKKQKLETKRIKENTRL